MTSEPQDPSFVARVGEAKSAQGVDVKPLVETIEQYLKHKNRIITLDDSERDALVERLQPMVQAMVDKASRTAAAVGARQALDPTYLVR